MVRSLAPSLEVAVPVFEDKNQAETLEDQKPAEILDRVAAADTNGQLMTSDKQEQTKHDRGLKRRRSAAEREAVSAGLTC